MSASLVPAAAIDAAPRADLTGAAPASKAIGPKLDFAGAERFLQERFLQECDWLGALPGLGHAARLLAAHTAGRMIVLRPHRNKAPAGLDGLFAALAVDRPSRKYLDAALDALEPDLPPAERDTVIAVAEALWPLASPTEHLLASGGDDRLALLPSTGLNKYGCAPWPRPDIISFGSCTASSLSQAAFDAAEVARRALLAASLATSPATALAEASEAIGAALLRHFGVEGLAEAVLAASGTDAALVVTGLLAAERQGRVLTSILVSPSETGSGVPNAVQGCHFADCAPTGGAVFKGQPIDGLPTGPHLVTVALRDPHGAPRPAADIEADCETAIRAGVADGHVVLHAMDGSKTGLTAPDRACCRRLAHAYGDRLDIVIDACQARLEPDMIRWYLSQGFPVLITGSKFFGAPGFCGAVLFPRQRLANIARAGRLPAGLAAYARLQGGFGSRRCPGLVLRWTAALHEMHAFRQLSAADIRHRLETIGRSIRTALATEDRLAVVDAPRPPGMGWSDCRSVFTFTVDRKSPGELRTIYEKLGPCQIGQPVELGSPRLGGLRLAISAAQVVEGNSQMEHLAFVVDKVKSLLF